MQTVRQAKAGAKRSVKYLLALLCQRVPTSRKSRGSESSLLSQRPPNWPPPGEHASLPTAAPASGPLLTTPLEGYQSSRDSKGRKRPVRTWHAQKGRERRSCVALDCLSCLLKDQTVSFRVKPNLAGKVERPLRVKDKRPSRVKAL